MSTLREFALEYLLNSVWQTPLVLLSGLTVGRIVRRGGPEAAHRIAVGALLLAIVLPACQVGLLPQEMPGLSLLRWFMHGRMGTVDSGQVQVEVMPGATASNGGVWLSHSLGDALLLWYAGVTVYFAARIAWGLWRVNAMRRDAVDAALSEALGDRWISLREQFGVRHARLGLSKDVPGPVVAGRCTVLLPTAFAEEVNAEDTAAALAHELVHLQRRDFMKNAAYAVAMLPVAYHPCSWMLYRLLALTRENVCDARSAEALDGKRSYARSLLRLATAMPGGIGVSALSSVGMFAGNTIERRVRTMMDDTKQWKGAGRVVAMSAVLMLGAGAMVEIAGMHLTVRAAEASSARVKKVSISSGVAAANVLTKVPPVYPQEAKAKHDTVDGTVTLAVSIDKQGNVQHLSVAKSLRADYDKSAIDAVKQWTYKPYLLNGNPVDVNTTINVTYSLQK